jgi:hypothetical protein
MPLPTHTFAKEEIKCRRGERYVSEAVNRKFMAHPLGVYLGYTPSVTAGSLVLTLQPDTTYGISLARTTSTLTFAPVDVSIDEDVTLDFAGHDFGADPTVYVMIRAAYDLGAPTTGEVFTRATGPVDTTEQLLCVITKPGDDLVADATEPTSRDTPFAWTTAPLGYGYMKDGAIEELEQAVAMVAEVEAAREDMTGFVHPMLDDRIVADLQPDAIASRLGRYLHVVRSNVYVVSAPQSSFDVSDSFTSTQRTFDPLLNIDGDGSESADGAVTDSERNICIVTIEGTNEKPSDSDGIVAFARLTHAKTVQTGTATFTQFSTSVVGVGSSFDTEFAAGELILGPDGECYEIASVGGPLALTLAIGGGFPNTGGTLPATKCTYTLDVKRVVSGVEVDYNFSNYSLPISFKFYFGAFFKLSDSIFDATLLAHEGGERAPLPDAAVGVEGKTLLHPLLTTGLAGAFKEAQDTGITVGGGTPVNTLNFDGAADGGSGVGDVTMTGEEGDQGDPGTAGPTGPPGATGSGFDSFSDTFDAGSLVNPPHTPGGTITHTNTYPGDLKYLHGGIANWSDTGGVMDSTDHFDITTVDRPSASQGRIIMTLPGSGAFPLDAQYQLFLNGAG